MQNLMKAGGLDNALKLAEGSKIYGIECMIWCMLEAKVSVIAAVHLAASRGIITKIDLDGPVLCSEDPVDDGAIFDAYRISLTDELRFGLKGIEGVVFKD